MMVRLIPLRHQLGIACLAIHRLVKNNRERSQRLVSELACQRHQGRRIDAATEKNPERHIADEMELHGFVEQGAGRSGGFCKNLRVLAKGKGKESFYQGPKTPAVV